MDSWIQLLLVSYFIIAISNLVDKMFLSNLVTESIIYAIWVSFLSLVAVAVLVAYWFMNPLGYKGETPLGTLSIMNPWFVFVAICVGILFTLAIYLLYSALQKGEASRVIPLIGGSMPVMIYGMTFYYDALDRNTLIAFMLLVVGSILISRMPKSRDQAKKRLGNWLALGASFSYALYFVVTQYLFREQGFLNGLVWPRIGTIFILVWLLAFPHIRHLLKESLRPLTTRMRVIWLSSQGLGAVGFLGQQYTISIPGVSAALVSALQSVQYVFILVIAIVFSIWNPSLLRESMKPSIIIQKVLALLCIGAGLYFIAL